MAAAIIISPSEDKAYCFRLLSLIIDGGTLVLRHQFDSIIPPADLQNRLNDPNTRGKLNSLRKKNVITSSQYQLLYPIIGQQNASSEDFDLTLLTCLLRYICSLDEKSPVWNGYPSSRDTSLEADIVRLKVIRNEISHKRSLSLTEQVFNQQWNDTEQVILRLGSGIADLSDNIQKMKECNIDPEKEKAYLKTIDNMPTKEISSELKNLASMSKLYLQDWSDQHAYVITTAHSRAWEKLQKSHIVVLSGLPGGGKTAMAIKLIYEVTEISSCLRLRAPADWTHVDLDQETFDTVFIDDIFGDGSLDETLVQGWKPYLQDIEKAARKGRLNVIITLRNYILEESREKLRKINIFKDENVQQLISSDLSDEERLQILQSHLTFANQKCDDEFMKRCNEAFKSTFIKEDISFTGSYLKDDTPPLLGLKEVNVMIGYPEIVHIFVTNDSLYSKGAKFFERPIEFFKKCLEDIYLDQSKFLTLILIWSRHENKLNVMDIEPPAIAEDIKENAKLFGFELKDELVMSVRRFLKYHSGGFLRFNPRTGDYTFCHNIVRDMVGIVAGNEHPHAVITLATQDFIVNCVTTIESKRDDLHLFVEEYRYKTLLAAILKVVMSQLTDDQQPLSDDPNLYVNDVSKLILMPLNACYKPCYCALWLEQYWNSDVVPALSNDAFANTVFLELFFEDEQGEFLMTKPVASLWQACEFTTKYNIIVTEKMKILLPSFLLLYGNDTMLSEYLESKFFDPFAKETYFLFVSLLIATDLGMENAIKMLLAHGAKPNDDVILIATSKSTRILEMLLDKWDSRKKTESHIINNNSPLIYAAKRGLVQSLNMLVRYKTDVNYRNCNGRSALDKAVQYCQVEACRILLENGAKMNEKVGKFKRTPLHMAADILKDKDTCLHRIVELLLEHGASTAIKDYRGHFPIHCAAIRGHNKVVDILLKADLLRRNMRITSYGRKSLIKGMTLLHIAVWKGNFQLMEILLRNNVDPDKRDNYGRTPLYCAAFNGKIEFVRELLEVSDPTIAEKNSFTPLHAAVHKRHHDIAKLLCPYSEVNAKDKFGKTPLHAACEKCDLDMVKMLVQDFNADLRIITKKGKSVFGILEQIYFPVCVLDDMVNAALEQPSGDRQREFEDCIDYFSEKDPEFATKYKE